MTDAPEVLLHGTDGSPQESATELPWIISSDDHVIEPPHLFERWLPASYRDRGPRIVTAPVIEVPQTGVGVPYVPGTPGEGGPQADWWHFEDTIQGIPQVMACVGYAPEDFSIRPMQFAEMRPGCYDPAERLADMDIAKIERSLCFPNYPRFAGQRFTEATDKDLGLACVRAYNDWMVEEWCGDSNGRLIPLIIIPMWDAQLAADEIRRNAARGVRALTFTELPGNLGLPSIHNKARYWDPMFQACDETGVVICMHIGSGSKMLATSDDAPNAVPSTLLSLNAFMAMADWLLSGTLVRFPNLKIAFSESQVGWMPFLLERLDRVFETGQGWMKDLPPEITEPPSTQVPGRVYGCFYDDMVGVDQRHVIGVTQMVFETDYPHQDSTWPHSFELVKEISKVVPRDELEMLIRTNAIDLFDLDPGDLRPEHAKAGASS
jgi:predicted TIM-barrel fold metal-dependent hydrolase